MTEKKTSILFLVLLGHSPALHDSSAVSFPKFSCSKQSKPPFCGSGLLHSLVLTLVPFPQVSEHNPQALHSLQPPSTKN